ncbi:putative magnesium transporter NIPA8 [Nicotiana tabacum]|uniref:Probable magnesium transporter n=2 Tax=Nicotiana TaxID=4085 RepID=A0A1S4CCE7_TOBAC|nr:PREDICTED: probable magnesium transporter NIPA8 [Nicotiana sylvestris]XP_016498629.1 PREDICTED: probable magnesium transporter NIPA8 [Nicotiana tabacum]
MGEWVIAAIINLLGSIIINFGTNLLKLGHDERKKHSKVPIKKPIIYFQTWRAGILFFAIGNCLNFISFGYAAQSLLAALGSIQFVSNIVFAYFLSNKTVTIKLVLATAFIVVGNIFLVAFGNHQSPVYMPEQLAENYTNTTFLLYCFTLVVLVVVLHHSVYKRGEGQMLVPFSYALVSGAIGSCSVLFAKSLSNMLRLSMSSTGGYAILNSRFTYSMLLMFLSTGGFWMARLNQGLSRFDAILIVPMFQIAWTFFSICTGFVYFEEYKVFDTLRTTMFILGMISVFVGCYLLAPEDDESYSKGGEVLKDEKRLFMPSQDTQIKDIEIIWTSYGDENC